MSEQKGKKIVVFGSIVQDLISYTERFPRPGESVRGDSFQLGAGGKGANQAVAAARLGVDVSIIAMVGDDIFGESNIKSLRDQGVDVSSIGVSTKTHTATATITVTREAENSIVVTLGANMELVSDVADSHETTIADASIIVCQGEIPEIANRRAFEIAKKHGVTTFLNPAPGDPKMDKSILELTDILCTNENEAEFLTGISPDTPENGEKAILRMLEMGPKHAIITLGPKGCLLASKGHQPKLIPGKHVEAVDTTGAGDCFCGSLAALLLKGVAIDESTRIAANLASLSVTRKGTQSSYWRLDEIRRHHPNLLPSTF
ncbi:unnamed protein product [Caenorhabditis bovis]|uniref:Ribokinase n=1 Tax=Caenorhabditis bovis TaxID=2654633 RepID=A0A8S1FCP1_9PELO|nr:unnamed protein product [Caenorhabditis bovis]